MHKVKDNKSILITGGSGFIGKAVKEALIDLSYDVCTIGRSKKEDICLDLNSEKLSDVIKQFLPNIVCHFASGSSVTRAEEKKEEEEKDTVLATKHLLDVLLSVNPNTKLLYLSSQAVYGLPTYLPVDEKHPLKPINFYGRNKLKAEELIIKSSLDYLIMRVSSVFGEKQDYKKSGVIVKFVNKLKSNKSPVVFNNIDLICDFIYVYDLVSAIVKIIELEYFPKEIVNLGSGQQTTLQDVLNILYKYFPHAPEPVIEKSELYTNENNKGIYLDISKIKNSIDWNIQYNVEKGLKHMLGNLSHV
ncbi:MAG: NAD(P)-dependent oxidoreductase [Candidatus Melainabacteria bacterium]|nr:NAD(P)-dependent oxidoreductase [Candidatus Melainabacteria bacterium]MBI3309417.1 NAD(P)-dependent oxidoreductase [Candidatus Melainabacteria bacterium]